MTAFIVGLMSFCFGFVIGGLLKLDGNGRKKEEEVIVIRYPKYMELYERKLQGLEGDEEECLECHYTHG